MKKTIKRIKENITQTEYKRLQLAVHYNPSFSSNSKSNYLRTFCILFYTGMRLNEVQSLRIKHIKELIITGSTKVDIQKTSTERKLFASNDFIKELKKLFDLTEDDENRVITKGSSSFKRDGIHPIVFISQVNSLIKEVLGEGFTSHSFRRGLITEMGTKGINIKLISKYIGHSDIKTTFRYITPSDEDIKNILIR